jgi:hypothetical protein
MIVVSDLAMTFDRQTLFKDVDLKFTAATATASSAQRRG